LKEVDPVLSRKSLSSSSIILCSIILIFAAALPLGQIYMKHISNLISGDESYALFHSSGIGSFDSQETIFEAKDVHEIMRQSGGLEEIWTNQYNFDTHPPLFFLLLSAQKYIFDGSLLSAKFVSYIFYVLSISIIYVFLRVSRFPYPFTATFLSEVTRLQFAPI
jgi:hypothetical protein